MSYKKSIPFMSFFDADVQKSARTIKTAQCKKTREMKQRDKHFYQQGRITLYSCMWYVDKIINI